MELKKTISTHLSKKDSGKNIECFSENTLNNLATSIYSTLKEEGCQNKDIVGLTTKLLDLVNYSIKNNKNAKPN
jgi:hypothetical protein